MATKAQATATASTGDDPMTTPVTYVGSSPTGVEVKLSDGWRHVDQGETAMVTAADAAALLEQGPEHWTAPATT